MSNLVKYRNDIDGLRAIAVLSVFIFHLKPSLLLGGFVGVDVFFVISGFLITKILLREIETNQFTFSGFYLRRIRRIFPALFVVLFVSLLVAILVLGPVDSIWFCKTLKHAAVQISNILFEKKVEYFDTEFDITPLLHTWSLGVEEQFYLVFPLLLFAIFKSENFWGKKDRNFAFASLLILSFLSLALSQFLLIKSPKVSFFSLTSRFWELGLGGLLAFDKIKKPKNTINEILAIFGLLLIATSLLLTNKDQFPGIYAFPACFGASLIIFSGQFHQTFVARILGNRILVFFGLISYALYLWHYPAIEFYKELSGSLEISTTAAAAIFLFTTFVSYLSYKHIEKPFRKVRSLAKEETFQVFGKEIYRPFIVSLGCILFFIAASEGLKSWQKHENKKIFGDSAKGKASSFSAECLIEEKVDFSSDFVAKCVKGEKKKDFEVLLIGDSHAWRYSSGLIEWAEKNNYSLAALGSTKCPSFIDNGKALCADFLTLVNNIVAQNKNLKYVILADRWDDDAKLGDEFTQKLSSNIKHYTDSGKQVVILGLVPVFEFDPVKCISRENALIRQATNFFEKKICGKAERSKAMPANEFLSRFFSKMVSEYDVKYFDPKKYLCDENFCYSIINGQVLYTDYHHLDFDGSHYIAKHFDF